MNNNRTPPYIDYWPVTPPGTTAAHARAPLVRVSTEAELHEIRVVDPVTRDTITCADLVQRDGDCWRRVDLQYPPRDAYRMTSGDHQSARAARSTCAVRRRLLLRVCRVGGVRAG